MITKMLNELDWTISV